MLGLRMKTKIKKFKASKTQKENKREILLKYGK